MHPRIGVGAHGRIGQGDSLARYVPRNGQVGDVPYERALLWGRGGWSGSTLILRSGLGLSRRSAHMTLPAPDEVRILRRVARLVLSNTSIFFGDIYN